MDHDEQRDHAEEAWQKAEMIREAEAELAEELATLMKKAEYELRYAVETHGHDPRVRIVWLDRYGHIVFRPELNAWFASTGTHPADTNSRVLRDPKDESQPARYFPTPQEATAALIQAKG